jgi:hypothetical protein
VAAKAAWWFYSQKPSFGASSPSGAQQFASLSVFLCIFMDRIFCVGYSDVSMMMMMMPPVILFLLDVRKAFVHVVGEGLSNWNPSAKS